MTAARLLKVLRLGRVEYPDGLVLQAQLARARRAGTSTDTLLLLEHPPTVTLGRGARAGHVLVSPEELASRGIGLYETDRGGDVTYHGPGQLVGYPILDLSGPRADVRAYVRSLEEGLIRALATFGLHAGRMARWPGVWLGEEGRDARKIAALGVHIAHWVTTHGFALNVCASLADFDVIIPCGIAEAGVTSMERELGRAPSWEDVQTAVARAYGDVWASVVEEVRPDVETVSVAVTREFHGEKEVLLLLRTPERGGFWQLVTGRRGLGESAEAAAAREVFEETGAAVAVRALDYRHAFALGETSPPSVAVEDAFAAAWESGGRVKLGPEHLESAWVNVPEALRRLPFAGLRRAVERASSAPGSAAWR